MVKKILFFIEQANWIKYFICPEIMFGTRKCKWWLCLDITWTRGWESAVSWYRGYKEARSQGGTRYFSHVTYLKANFAYNQKFRFPQGRYKADMLRWRSNQKLLLRTMVRVTSGWPNSAPELNRFGFRRGKHRTEDRMFQMYRAELIIFHLRPMIKFRS